ncbi:MAG: YcgN family cysteine cluster protein [Treponema sp.]|nr:YcgN family cysteine cluster protein [Treponema sp.]
MTSSKFKPKSLAELTPEEWESLCDGCGRCCYRKYITGYGKREKIHYTRVACDLMDLKTGKCRDYENRFKIIKDCLQLTKNNVSQFDWLPETCAYRLVYEGKPLPDWHPLISGRKESVGEAGILIQNGIHESEVDECDWDEYEI